MCMHVCVCVNACAYIYNIKGNVCVCVWREKKRSISAASFVSVSASYSNEDFCFGLIALLLLHDKMNQ